MRLLCLIILATGLAACTNHAETKPAPLTVRQEAASAFNAYVEALNNNDLETARAFYDREDGFHWVDRGAVTYETGEEAANALQPYQDATSKSVMTIEDMHVAALGPDAAFVTVKFRFSIFMPGDNFMEIPGLMSVGMVRREDGWKMAAGMTKDR